MLVGSDADGAQAAARRQLFVLLDGLSWVMEASAAAYASVVTDAHILRCLREAVGAVWLKGGRAAESGAFVASLPLAETTLRLCLLRQPNGTDREDDPAAPLGSQEQPPGDRLLVDILLEQQREGEDETEGQERGGENMGLSRSALVGSLVIFLLQPAALGFSRMEDALQSLRRLAVSVIRALELPATGTSPLSPVPPGGGCRRADSSHSISAAVKEWLRRQRQQQQLQEKKDEQAETEGPQVSRESPWICGATPRGCTSDFLSSLLAPVLSGATIGSKARAKPCCLCGGMRAFVEGLEALEDVYGCGYLLEKRDRRTLLLTNTCPAAAAEAVVCAAANVLRGERLGGSLLPLEETVTRDEETGTGPFAGLSMAGRRERQHLAALLLRLGLLYLRCAASSCRGSGDFPIASEPAAASGGPKGVADVQGTAQTLLAIASFPLYLLISPLQNEASASTSASQWHTRGEAANAVSFLSTLRALRCCLFGVEAFRRSPRYVHLLRALVALVRRQTAAAAGVSPVEAAEWTAAAAGGTAAAGEKEEQLLLHVVLAAFELWRSSDAWAPDEPGPAAESSASPSAAPAATGLHPLLREQQAALADLFVAVSSWPALLRELPLRGDALQFVAERTAQFLSGAVCTPTAVKAATLRGGFVAVLLTDLLHEASLGQRLAASAAAAAAAAAAACGGTPAGSSGLQQQQQQTHQRQEEEEQQSIAARRGLLSAALCSCNDSVSAMIGACFPLSVGDLWGRSSPSLKGGAFGETSAEARRYAALLSALLDATLRAFAAAADWAADAHVALGTSAPTGTAGGTATGPAMDSGKETLTAQRVTLGGQREGGKGTDGQQTAAEERRRFHALSLCLTHLHDTLREEHQGFQKRLGRFLTSLVATCSQQSCPRLCTFVLSHCLMLMLVDVPPQQSLLPPQRVFGGAAATALKRPALGPRLVELLALPLLFAAGRSQAATSGGSSSLFCEVWNRFWGRLVPLLSPKWEAVLLSPWWSHADSAEREGTLAALVRQLQVFASACGFVEVLFSVTPLAVFKEAVAAHLLQQQRGSSSQAAAGAAAVALLKAAGGPPPGTAVTRQVIGALSSAMRSLGDCCFSPAFHYRHQQGQKPGEEEAAAPPALMSEALRLWLWKSRVRAYGCLSAVVCSTQSNAALYVSLLVSEASGLPSLLEPELVSLAKQMRQQGDAVLPLWPPPAAQAGRQQLGTTASSFSFADMGSSGSRRQQSGGTWGGSLPNTIGRTLLGSVAAPTPFIRGSSQLSFSQASRSNGVEGRGGGLFLQMSQSMAQTRIGEILLDRRFGEDPLVQRAFIYSQSLQPGSPTPSQWLPSLVAAPRISSTFAAAEWSRVVHAAAAFRQGGGETPGSPQERVEARLSGRTADTAEAQHNVSKGT